MTAFAFDRRVEFCETDAAGIAHFSSLIQYMEQAEHALLRSVGLSVFDQRSETITWPRVHLSVDFLGPARFEDVLKIDVVIKSLGKTSVRYGFSMRSPRGAVATGEVVSVCCVKKQGKDGSESLEKTTIPVYMREALQTFLRE